MDDYKARFANPYSAAERGYIDDVIEPHETRPKLIHALKMLETKRVRRPQAQAREHPAVEDVPVLELLPQAVTATTRSAPPSRPRRRVTTISSAAATIAPPTCEKGSSATHTSGRAMA